MESENRKSSMANLNTRLLSCGIILAVIAAFIGGVIGRKTAPAPRMDGVIVTESASPLDQVIAANTNATGEQAEVVDPALSEGSGKEYTQIVSTMDNMRHVVDERYIASDGRLVTCEDGYAIIRNEYDTTGNKIRTSYYNIQDQTIVVEKLGYASIVMEYDENNKKIDETYYDAKGEIVSKNGQEYAGVRYEYDEYGNVAVRSYFDENDQPILCSDEYHKAVFTYDTEKHCLSERYYDTEGKLTIIKKGYAGVDHEYDDAGNDKKCKYVGLSGEYEENTKGVSIIKRTYNKLRQVVKEEYRDQENHRTINRKLGYCIVEKEYDDNGNISRQTFYDKDKEPFYLLDLYVEVRDTYDENKNIIEESYYDADGNLMLSSKGYAKLKRQYDESGNVILETYYNEKNEKAPGKDGVIQVARSYNEAKKVLVEQYQDADGNPFVKPAAGYASVEYAYHDNGKKSEERYFDENHQPVLSAKGYAGILYEYDDEMHCTKTAYLDTTGAPALVESLGYAIVEKVYDQNGKVTKVMYQDADGKDVTIGDDSSLASASATDEESAEASDQTGYSSIEKTYDEEGRVVEERFVGSNGETVIAPDKGYAKVTHEYDENGREIRKAYFDENDEPRVIKGAATIEKEYDKAGNVTVTKNYNVERAIVLDAKKGYAFIRYEYNNIGQPVKETFCDEDGDPMIIDGYAVTIKEYDAHGNVARQAYFDAYDNPISLSNGAHIVYKEYDINKKVVYTAYYGINGDAVTIKTGCSIIKNEYDEGGNMILESYFDGNENPVSLKVGNAAVRKTYNDQKKVTRTDYLDTDGNLVAISTGVASVLNEYDENGNMISETYLDTDGDPHVISKKNKKVNYAYAEIRKTYNENNMVLETSYYDSNDNLTTGPKGFATQRYEYDARGRQILTEWLDVYGNLYTNNKGYASMESTYDAGGNRKDTYYNAYGNEVNVQ